MASLTRVKGDVRPLPNDVLVTDMERGFTRTKSGIILMDDSDATSQNIKPRWCKVYRVGANVTDVKPTQWVLVEHGRWTYGVTLEKEEGQSEYLHKIDPDAILAVADSYPGEERLSSV